MNAQSYVDQLPELETPLGRRAWLRRMLDTQPPEIANGLADQHRRTYNAEHDQGRPNPMRPANIELREFVENTDWILPPNASEDYIRTWAERRARECLRNMQRVNGDEDASYQVAADTARSFGFQPPEPKGAITVYGCIARLTDPQWWRRKARTVHGRQVEQTARALGRVHKNNGLYISDLSFQRWASRQAINARSMADTVAECDTGEKFTLDEIAAAGVSNPSKRFAETMNRIRGAEAYADQRGDNCIFVTLTAPPEWHAVDSRTCIPGTGRWVTPCAAHEWLNNQWRKVRAKLDRLGVTYYGERVVEPHHDGTPHWHLLVFMAPEDRVTVQQVLQDYALDGSTELARVEHACKIEAIDRSKGTAAGYVVKYIAKALDGHGLDTAAALTDSELIELNIDPTDNAQRVRAWASVWGIRQFQSFGLPTIGPWRELRRLSPITNNDRAESLRAAADNGDFARYIELMGGAGVKASDRPARIRYETDSEVGRYGEFKQRPYIEAFGSTYTSRLVRWDVRYDPTKAEALRNGESTTPWTRGNNCTRPPVSGARQQHKGEAQTYN